MTKPEHFESERELCERLGIVYAFGQPYINISEVDVTLDGGFSASDLRKIADEIDRLAGKQIMTESKMLESTGFAEKPDEPPPCLVCKGSPLPPGFHCSNCGNTGEMQSNEKPTKDKYGNGEGGLGYDSAMHFGRSEPKVADDEIKAACSWCAVGLPIIRGRPHLSEYDYGHAVEMSDDYCVAARCDASEIWRQREGVAEKPADVLDALKFYANDDNWNGCDSEGLSIIDNSPAGIDSGDLAKKVLRLAELERAVIDAAIRWSIYQEPLLSDEENLQRAVDALLAARGGK